MYFKSHIETEECCSLDDTTSVIHKVISIGYACECCSIEFLSAQHLQQHRLSPKHDDRLFYCPICRKVFKTLKHMRNHLNYHKDYDDWLNIFPIARYYMCNVGDCIDAYPLWTSLYYHKKRHKNDDENTIDKLTCQFCQKLCSTKMSLAVHVARVHNNSK